MTDRKQTDVSNYSSPCMGLRGARTQLQTIMDDLTTPDELAHPGDDEYAAEQYAEIQRLADKVAQKAAFLLVELKSQLPEDVRNKVSDRIVAAVSEHK